MRRIKKSKKTAPKSKARSRKVSKLGPRERALVACGLAILLAVGTLTWAWQSGWIHRQADRLVAAAYGLTVRAGFSVQDVSVEGRKRTDPSTILATLGVKRGSPILAMNPADARLRLEALPWVATASVERRLPGQVYVRLAERSPLALWQLDGEISVIDTTGAVLQGVEPRNFARLPLVVGKGAPQKTAALLAMLNTAPQLGGLVTAAVRVGERRWNLRLKGGIEIHLPAERQEEAWTRLVELQQRHDLLARDVATIDMRLPGRLMVRSSSGRDIEKRSGKSGQST